MAAGQPLPDPPTVREQGEVIAEHYRLSEQLYGERCGAMMRKFGIKYSALHPAADEVKAGFIKVRRREDWLTVLDHWYTHDAPGCYPPPDIHRSQQEC